MNFKACEICGAPATDSVRDVNASGPWVDVCDAHADTATEHAADCDCDDCATERELDAAAAAHGVRVGWNGDVTDFPSWLVEREEEGVLGAVGRTSRGTWEAENHDTGRDGTFPDAESAVRWVVKNGDGE